jgi:hypothetical protein
VAELADAADSKANALHFLKRAYRYTSENRVYLERRPKKAYAFSLLLTLTHGKVIDKLWK